MRKEQFPHKILWLASYPKSGNTWFRAFLSALLNGGSIDINDMKADDGIFSSRNIFDWNSDIDSRDLYEAECRMMMGRIYRSIAERKTDLSIIKVHDRFEAQHTGEDFIPEDVTHCAIYFIRNPLDVAGSLANHMQFSMADAVKMLNDPDACMAKQPGNQNKNNQLRQRLSDWSGHVASWTLFPSFPVLVLRYEDMLNNTFQVFKQAIDYIGWHFSDDEVIRAIEATNFTKLRQQEENAGFAEKHYRSPVFFRAGTMDNWKNELSHEQITSIKQRHEIIMKKFGYT